MSVFKSKKFQISAAIVSALVLVLIVVFVDFGGQKEIPATHSKQAAPEGFTFFDLGEHSELTDGIRDRLRDKLGSEAVEKWSTLDLDMNYKGFLQKYFKELDTLNKRLNFPPGERVEHNIVKLRYRYALRKNVPFKYVELVFSNHTTKPLLFKIQAKKEGSFIIDTIREKHGEPHIIHGDQDSGKSLYWKKNKSFLIIAIRKDRYGDPEYHIGIYFSPNIEELLSKEKLEAKQAEEEIKKKGKTAF